MSQPEEFDDDRPWTEAQWEAFMKRADARSAKFGEGRERMRRARSRPCRFSGFPASHRALARKR